MIGLISATAAGAVARDRLAAAWPDRTRVYEGSVGEAVRAAFAECEQLVCFLATGAVVRLLAPLLGDKASDPGVVCVDEGARFAVSLVGGHAGGANELAREVGESLGAVPVVTTATDSVGLPGLDTLGFPVEGDVAGVSRALLDGEPVALETEVSWPLPPLRVAAEGAYTIRVTDAALEPAEREAVLRPPTLVVGVGASKGSPVEEILELIDGALREAGLSARSLAELATVDAKADEPGIVEAARRLGVPLVTYSSALLAEVDVPNPSDAPLAAVGTPSVAEAAALVRGGELLVPKRKSAARPATATCAVVRRPGRGRLAVVGLGPGARDLLTPRAKQELRRASVVVGLDQYVDQIRDLLRPGTRILESGLVVSFDNPVSYTHLSRPTIFVVLIWGGAVS
ncbi:cobalamin biosynthesis protein, partial [Streptomyces sp. NPDC059717]|uniref:cobalamin biosynthesis protein n=1 Tax=Streptomyces sp. NPDC059717 TaxID=3346922 RepID=UPI0036B7C1AC